MLPIVHLGPLTLQLPGLILLAGVWLGMTRVEKEVARLKLPDAAGYNLVFYGLVAGIVGARLWYAVRFLDVYLENPLDLFSLNSAALAPAEGLLTGVLAALLYGWRKGLPFWPTLDALTPGLALFAVFLGLAHLSSGDAFGAPTALPWGIDLWGERRHPSQVYEIIAAGLILLIVWRLRAGSPFESFTFLTWVALTAAGRLLLEAFRGDSVIVLGELRAAQVASLALLMAALLGLHLRSRAARVEI